jgi:hypothetical protein
VNIKGGDGQREKREEKGGHKRKEEMDRKKSEKEGGNKGWKNLMKRQRGKILMKKWERLEMEGKKKRKNKRAQGEDKETGKKDGRGRVWSRGGGQENKRKIR